MRIGLMISACLGPKFDAKMLQKASPLEFDPQLFLSSCVELGFVQDVGGEKVAWAHGA